MNRLLCFLMVLSAITLFIFYQVAVLFPDSAFVVMGWLCVICGLAACVIAWFTGKRLVVSSAAWLSAVFMMGIHPFNSWHAFVGFAVLVAGFFVAVILDHLYKKEEEGGWVFTRILLSTAIGLGGAIVAQHLAYRSPSGETLSLTVAMEAMFFLAAFLMAPWRPEDSAAFSPRALWKRFGKRTAN